MVPINVSGHELQEKNFPNIEINRLAITDVKGPFILKLFWAEYETATAQLKQTWEWI